MTPKLEPIMTTRVQAVLPSWNIWKEAQLSRNNPSNPVICVHKKLGTDFIPRMIIMEAKKKKKKKS